MCLYSCWSIAAQLVAILLKGSKQLWVEPLWHLTLIQQGTDSISGRNICISSRGLQQYYGMSRNYSLAALEGPSPVYTDYNQKVLREHGKVWRSYDSRCWLCRAITILCRQTNASLLVFKNVFWILMLKGRGEKVAPNKTEVCIYFFRRNQR